MSDTSLQDSQQLGLLDLSVDLSVPEVYSGTEFTLYLHVKNPFSQPVWIKSVELSLPAQLSALESNRGDEGTSKNSEVSDEITKNIIRERQSEIKRLRDLAATDGATESEREKSLAKANELEDAMRADLASLSGALSVASSGHSIITLNDYGEASTSVHAAGGSRVTINSYKGSREGEDRRVRLVGSIPARAALQPGSTDVWTIRLESKRTPFFIPAKFKLQLTVIYGLEAPPVDDHERDGRDLYSNTTPFTVQVRAALWSVILGSVFGGVIGSIARSLQGEGGAVAFSGPHANSTIGALLLAAILSGAAVLFSARKSDTQSFVTVEDFWGGLLVGFLIGYSGTAAFAKITNT
jgi:hypothetical protein